MGGLASYKKIAQDLISVDMVPDRYYRNPNKTISYKVILLL